MMNENTERSALIVDDHPLVARGMADYLRSLGGFARVASVTRVEEIWEYCATSGPPTLAVVDFWLSGGTAMQALSRLQENCPATRLLVVSGDSDPDLQRKVAGLSVHGFLLKNAEPCVFLQAVETLLAGGQWFRDELPAVTAGESWRELPLSPAELGLTHRQGEVLAMMLKGLPNKRVAQALSLSEQTVKEHVTGILERLGARNRVELIMRLRGKRVDV